MHSLERLDGKRISLVLIVHKSLEFRAGKPKYSGRAVAQFVKGTALPAGRSRVRFLIVSLEFFIDIILLTALWPLGRLNL